MQPADERFPRRQLGELIGRAAQAFDLVDVDGLEQRLPVWEVAIERADTDLRAPRDLLERRRGPPFGEGLARGGDHLVVVAPRVCALRAGLDQLLNGVGGAHWTFCWNSLDNRRGPPYSTGGCLHLLPEAASTLAPPRIRLKLGSIQMNTTTAPAPVSDRRRWMALAVVCLAQLMIVLDTTIVNVALPAIQRDLHFTQGNLTWVVNAFLVTFGSLLLLAGRLGDLLGRRRIFLLGSLVFTAASALCGLAPNQGFLIAARFLQGVGAALQASVILAIIVTEFPQAADRARAMSAYVFVSVVRRFARTARRWRADPDPRLALDLLRQPPDRRRGDDPRQGADSQRRGSGAGARRRLARLDPRHRVADDCRVRDRASHELRLGLLAGARLRSPGGRADGRVPRCSRRGSRTRSCRCASSACRDW